MASSGISLPLVPHIAFGTVWHKRLKPVEHVFSYPTYFLMLPMRFLAENKTDCSVKALKRNRWALLSFYDKDHGDGRSNALAWLDELLHKEGIDNANGEVWLHCYPRVLGYAFKPVSFWYCHQSDGTLRAIVAEVNNTFGERHCYLLDEPAFGQDQTTTKQFHVSPFNKIDGNYRFHFLTSPHSTTARIDLCDTCEPVLLTNISGKLEVLTKRTTSKALWLYPAMTWGVIFNIHWQAWKLWRKRLVFVSKPKLPDQFVSRR